MKCKAINGFYEKRRYRSDYFDAKIVFHTDKDYSTFSEVEIKFPSKDGGVTSYPRTIFKFIDILVGNEKATWAPKGGNGIKAPIVKDIVFEKGDIKNIFWLLFEKEHKR